MTPEEFNMVFDAQMARCQDVLGLKAKEYASDTDKLHNFKVAAVLQDETVAQALQGMATKHTISIADMINSDVPYAPAIWLEKITDSINYLILLRAVIAEQYRDELGLPLIWEEKE